MQSSEKDEFLYHESLVHPVLINHPNPKRVFVGGGGEGATVREILRHKSVEKVVMVDIDGECVDVCKRFLPNHHQGNFDNPRLELVIDDAKAYLERTKDKFDVIFFDLSDPVEGGPAKLLYTQKFYEMCATRLNEGGILATQAGPAGPATATQVFTAIHKTMSTVFPHTYASSVFIPSFCDSWGYVVGSFSDKYNPTALSQEEVDARLAPFAKDMRFLDGESYQGLFLTGKNLREDMKKETRVITEDTPLVIP
jgi:spermidine synthase